VAGFRFAGVRCGIKRRGLDLALLASDRPASAAGVFTRSTVPGAPVVLARRRLRSGRARAVVVNSGISNVAMGKAGLRAAERMSARAAAALGVRPAEVLPASTGLIGVPLPLDAIERGLPRAVRALAPDGIEIAKGSGMIEPRMATMLAFLATDAAVAPATLRRLWREVADETFNRVTVDGETSTSDTAIVLANGAAGGPALGSATSAGARSLRGALLEVAGELARALARDGEGATKLVTVRVDGAKTPAQAELAARRIANSLLVKTAIFGRDPNWGRILQTVGAGRVALDLARTEVRLCGVPVFRRGASTGLAARARAGRRMKAPEIEIAVQLAAGKARCHIWTCDLSYGYVRINAEYTT
jgi:glutamate N-acetyltransferase/amino-acid N-acetyltransferase